MGDLFPKVCKKRVGYWITNKKYKRLNFDLFEILCRSKGIDLVEIKLEDSLEEQGPFNLILHKVSDLLLRMPDDVNASKSLDNFQNYLERHPEVVVVDPLERVLCLLDRNVQYKFAKQCNLLGGDHKQFFVPAFTELASKNLALNKQLIQMNNITFPIVCKPSVSAHIKVQSSDSSLTPFPNPDEMMIIFDEGGLDNIVPPCVVQSFINHNARLFKVFIVGEKHFTIERPSIRNFYTAKKCQETIFFKSSDISKSNSSSFLNQLDEGDVLRHRMIEVDDNKIDHLVRSLRSRFSLDLFGFDVIIENVTGRYAVIDINPFPGYDGVREFLPCLLDLVQTKINQTRKIPVTTPSLYSSSSSSPPLPYSLSLVLSPLSSSSSSSSSSLSSSPQTLSDRSPRD